MLDKTLTAAAVADKLRDGMTIGIGGWGPRRKPMALIRAILRSALKDLTVVAYGGPDVGMLCAAGKVRKLIYGFVSLDAIPVEPWFRRARESGSIEARELDEGLLQWGLRAAGMRVQPERIGEIDHARAARKQSRRLFARQLRAAGEDDHVAREQG